MHRGSARLGAELLGQTVQVVRDQGRSRRYDASRASPVAPERDGARHWEAAQESLETGARGAAEPIDRLVVVAHHEGIAAAGDQLHQPLLGQVEVLVFVDQHVRVASRVAPPHLGLLLQEPDREQDQVVEVQEALPVALPLVGVEEPRTGAHECRLLGVIGRRGPRPQTPERDQLLLHALEHLQDRCDQVVGPLFSGQRGIPDRPHQLPSDDPPVRPGQDSKARRNADPPAVLAQPAERYGVERAHGRGRRLDPFLDPFAHLVGRPLREGHDENRRGRNSRCHEPAEPFGDDGGLPGPRSGHHPHRAGAKCRGARLLPTELHDGVDRPMRTRSTRTLRPRSGRLSRARIASASSLS